MNRRDLLKMITAATGVAMVGNVMAYEIIPAVPLKDTGFTKEEVSFLNEIGEVILPRTDTPGAKDADVGTTMAVLVADCYPAAMQKAFRDGLKDLNATAKDKYGKDFLLLSADDKKALLTTLDSEARSYNSEQKLGSVENSSPSSWGPQEPTAIPHYFSLIKQLVLFSFFTSETGATKVLRYVAIPTKYDGDLPYKKGDRAWAT